MNGLDLRSSQSSYGDPRHFSAASYGVPQPPPTKVLLEGYRDDLDAHAAGKLPYNPLNTTAHHPRTSIPLSANDPVAMYLLTETAMGDSMNYEVLSLEEVEGLKKEHKLLSGRMNASKRKLTLELKLRDAAMSLSRLNNHRSSRTSEDYDSRSSPDQQRGGRSALGRTAATLDKTDEELALSNRKCEELAQEIWIQERRLQDIQRRLLEHTAGVLQLTHKGLKKNSKNGIPHTPESLSSANTVEDFDERSLYKPSDHAEQTGANGTGAAVDFGQIENTNKKLEFLSSRMREMILHSHPDSDFAQIPQPSNNGGSVNSTAMVDSHLAYIEDALNRLDSQPREATPNHSVLDPETQQYLSEMSAQLFQIVENPGLPRSQTLPSLPDSNSGLSERLAYLGSGINGLQERVEKLLDQKSILTTQIQQQRELNSKSDAERDAHIADLIEQLAHVRKELELSERQGQQSREELNLAMEELEEVRQDLAEHTSQGNKELSDSEKEARAYAEAEIARLQHLVQEIQHERDEHHETRVRAENEVSRLESLLDQLRSEQGSNKEELNTARSETSRLESLIEQLQSEHAGQREELNAARAEVTRLESLMEQLRSEHGNNTEELNAARVQAENEVVRLQGVIGELQAAAESRGNTEHQISQLEDTIAQLRADVDSRIKEANDMRLRAESEITRLEASMVKLQSDVETQIKEATEGRTAAEEISARLQVELTELEGEVVRAQTELTMVKAELDGAYGTRAQRAAEAAANPTLQKEFEELNARNIELAEELAALKAGKPGSGDVQTRVETLERELRETVDDYEAMTKASIEFEKEREKFEGIIDGLRDRCEQLETQLNEERIGWMGIHNSASAIGRDGTYETTSTMVLKNEFKKMMRDTRAENMKILKAEHEERRKLEGIIRALKKEQANPNSKSSLSQSVTAL